jgi:hypothetical protein
VTCELSQVASELMHGRSKAREGRRCGVQGRLFFLYGRRVMDATHLRASASRLNGEYADLVGRAGSHDPGFHLIYLRKQVISAAGTMSDLACKVT